MSLLKQHRKQQGGFVWILYLLPALLVYTFFMAYPLLNSMRLSFFSAGSHSADVLNNFVGFGNYARLFSDPDISARYWGAFGNTWIFFAIHMIVQNSLGILFANLLARKKLRGTAFFRTVIFIPATLSILVTGYLWKLILNPQWGAVNLVLKALGYSKTTAWLGNSILALPVISLTSVWQWVGMPTMMFLAGLQNIPEELYESADIDGASPWHIFWNIKLPLLRPVIGIIAILTFVNNFNAFDVVYAMATVDGNPSYSTDILGTLFYRVGIAGEHPLGIPDRGLGAAIATITFIILVSGVLLIMKTARTNQEDSL